MTTNDDYEESLISQFETTLSIRPSNETQNVDLSIDHTTVIHAHRNELFFDIPEDEEENTFANIKSVKARKGATDPLLARALEPSPLIDLNLNHFKALFAEFLRANPHIEAQSPRFKRETDKTLVLLSPYSAEHAFGRKWVSRAYLNTIFERPQRLLALSLGVAAALTMFPFLYSIRASTKKSSILSPHVLKVHGKTWPKKLIQLCVESHEKLQKGELEVPEDWNTGDIYLTPKSITALEGVLGTIEAAVDALYASELHDLAFVMIRPPGHHCHASLPSGFCMLNNAQIGVEYAHDKYQVSHCAILDIDLHHGDGTQDICWERAGFEGDYGKDAETPRDRYGKSFATFPKVGYFSLHDIKSYPTELGFATKDTIRNASLCVMDHDLSLWNIHLQDWANEEDFYKLYQTKYVAILNRANQFLNNAKKAHEQEQTQYAADLARYSRYIAKPHLFKQPVKKPVQPVKFKPMIVISAGFDASEYENPQMQRHGVNVPTSFYATFSKDVVKLAQVHPNCKVISFLEGGYSDAALISGVFSHLIGFTKNLDDEDEVLWNSTWGSEAVVKELVKGCKSSWAPYRNPKADVTIWANEVIKLGRSLIPNCILPPNYVCGVDDVPTERDIETLAKSRMLRNILEGTDVKLPESPIKADPTDARRVIRHTRSYYRKK